MVEILGLRPSSLPNVLQEKRFMAESFSPSTLNSLSKSDIQSSPEKNISTSADSPFKTPRIRSQTSVLDQFAAVALNFLPEAEQIEKFASKEEEENNVETVNKLDPNSLFKVLNTNNELLKNLSMFARNEEEAKKLQKQLNDNNMLLQSFHSTIGSSTAGALATPVNSGPTCSYSPISPEIKEIKADGKMKLKAKENVNETYFSFDQQDISVLSELSALKNSPTPKLKSRKVVKEKVKASIQPPISSDGVKKTLNFDTNEDSRETGESSGSPMRPERKSKSRGLRTIRKERDYSPTPSLSENESGAADSVSKDLASSEESDTHSIIEEDLRVEETTTKVRGKRKAKVESSHEGDTSSNEDSNMSVPQQQLHILTKTRRPRKKKDGESSSSRKKRKNEWNDREIVILLQVTKIMIDCELKSVAKALFEIIERSPGKSYGRAAEKKLKRMEIFENWKKCDKDQTLKNIDTKLEGFGELGRVVEQRTLDIANRYRSEELGQRYAARVRPALTLNGVPEDAQVTYVAFSGLDPSHEEILNNSKMAYVSNIVKMYGLPPHVGLNLFQRMLNNAPAMVSNEDPTLPLPQISLPVLPVSPVQPSVLQPVTNSEEAVDAPSSDSNLNQTE